MDLIYTDENREDLGVLFDYSFDLAFGSSENDFELKTSTANHILKEGYFLYMEGTEYGGVVDNIKVKTKSKELIYGGRTYHGILESKIIEPNEGEDYLIVSGEANEILAQMIERLQLTDMFKASEEVSNITINNYKFNRYVAGYSGIKAMLNSVGAKLHITFENGYVVLSALPIVDYSKDDEFDTDQIKFDIEKYYHPTNHLICLGKGELAERQVIHLYSDTEGNISKTQTQFGLNERTETYDYSSVESIEELESSGIEKFKELLNDGKVQMQLDASQEYDIDDIVGAKEFVTGITMSKAIVKKIVTINKGIIKVENKVGEE